jgi:hypothetical protein
MVSMVAYYTHIVNFNDELFVLHLDARLLQLYIVDVVAKTKQNILKFLVLNEVQLCAKL